MIVQSSRDGGAHLVLTMEQHTATGGTLATHYGGTGSFARLEPHDLVVGLVREHDRGWVEVDAVAARDPDTDLPWSVYETPASVSSETGPRSIDHNERCHPYRGLLASMHIVGLYAGRFGLSEVRRIDAMDDESRVLVEPMIDDEILRQARLRVVLAGDDVTAAWLVDEVLMRNYKALQFFDGLALWLQVTHPAHRRVTTFEHVPTVGDEDVTLTVTPIDEHRVIIDPFPFDADPLEVVTEGRWLTAQSPGIDLARALRDAEPAQQHVTLCSA